MFNLPYCNACKVSFRPQIPVGITCSKVTIETSAQGVKYV